MLVYSIESKLRPTVDFLVRVGVPEQRVGQVVSKKPLKGRLPCSQPLTCSQVVSKKPQLLGYSVSTKLVPAVLFLQHEVRAAP